MIWLDKINWAILIFAAAMLGLAPFQPEPHLVEKLRMLFQGNLGKPTDVFDLFMHGTPLILLTIKAIRQFILHK